MLRLAIDTDPGADDAIALLAALSEPTLDLQLVTVVAGNARLASCGDNARRVLDLVGADQVPVVLGSAGPLLGSAMIDNAVVMGVDGLAGADLPPPSRPPDGDDAVRALARLLEVGPATILALGPLTNLALLLRIRPDLAPRIQRLVAFAGSLGFGNATPLAEYNVLCDPEAAQVLLDSGIEVTLAPLERARDTLTTPSVLARIAAAGRLGPPLARMLDVYARFDRERFGWPGGMLPDPHAVALLVRPDLYRLDAAFVSVETGHGPARGATSIDRFGMLDRPPNARVATAVDVEGFLAWLVEAIARLSDQSRFPAADTASIYRP